MYQKSLIIFKPDAIQRCLVGRILQRFDDMGLKIHAARFEKISKEQSRRHYEEHVDKFFYPSLEDYITSKPVLIMVLGGFQAVSKIRLMVGDTSPSKALPGTIRGDFAHGGPSESQRSNQAPIQNLLHASADSGDADREIKLWFTPDEILDYILLGDDVHGL